MDLEFTSIETPAVSCGYNITTTVFALKVGDITIPIRAFGANDSEAGIATLSDWKKLTMKLAASEKMYEALRYCYDHIRDAANSGVDISSFYGEMEWRMREALQKANGGELE